MVALPNYRIKSNCYSVTHKGLPVLAPAQVVHQGSSFATPTFWTTLAPWRPRISLGSRTLLVMILPSGKLIPTPLFLTNPHSQFTWLIPIHPSSFKIQFGCHLLQEAFPDKILSYPVQASIIETMSCPFSLVCTLKHQTVSSWRAGKPVSAHSLRSSHCAMTQYILKQQIWMRPLTLMKLLS